MNTALARPHSDSYVVPGFELIAGEYPFAREEAAGRQKLATILAAGVTCFVDLTEMREASWLRPYVPALRAAAGGKRPRHLRLSVHDNDVPPTARMTRILNVLDAALAAGERVYLHCWGGVGRTGTVVGCFLVRHGMTGEEALKEVARLYGTMSPAKRRRHTGSPETLAQCEFVRRWREDAAASRHPRR